MEKIKSEVIEIRPDVKDNLCLDIYYNSQTHLYKIILYDSKKSYNSEWSDSPIPKFKPYIDEKIYDYKQVQKVCIDTIENHKKWVSELGVKSLTPILGVPSITPVPSIKPSEIKSTPKIEQVDPKLDLSDLKVNSDGTPYKPNEQVNPADTIKILDLFLPNEMTVAGSGTYKMVCPDCGLQGGRTEGFIIFPDSNSAYCQSSHKWFRMLEAYALKKKIIRCLDGREPGADTKQKILAGELWTLTLEEFKNQYGTDKYNELAEQMKIKKSVEIPGNNRTVSAFADELGDIYRTRNILFRRAETGDIIRIDRNTSINEDGEVVIERGLKKMEPESFVSFAEMLINPWTTIFTKSGQSMNVTKSMTQSHASLTLNSDNFKNKLPVLHRVLDIQIPMMYKKSLTFPKKGYDKRFGTWLPYNAPQIKRDMFNLEQAKGVIYEIFSEFCFESEKDKLFAIAGFFTPFCRGMFEDFATRTPVFVYMANRERAGKDFLANCSGMLYEGVANEQNPICTGEDDHGNSNEELRKKITACMLENRKRFHSSNNKGLLNNSVFESATTNKVWTDRVLGKSKNVTYNNEIDYSLSGNIGMHMTPDMKNRARVVKLLLIDEDANARVFKNPKLHTWILERRMMIISAMYTIVEHWVKQGMPKGSVPFTSFPEWADIVGGILETAGFGNPCIKDDDGLISLDTDTEEMKELYETCHVKYQNQWIDKPTIYAEAAPILTGVDFTKKSDLAAFALRIDKFVNRILSGIMLKVNSRTITARHRKYMFFRDPPLQSLAQTPNTVSTPIENLTDNSKSSVSNVKDVKDVKEGRTVATLLSENRKYGGDLDNLDNLDIAKKGDLSNTVSAISEKKVTSFKDIDEIAKDYLRKEIQTQTQKRKKKEKTGRELQFWEDPQCANIVPVCTKEQTYEWVKNNPGTHYKQMRKDLGLGASRYVVELTRENKIKRTREGWEII